MSSKPTAPSSIRSEPVPGYTRSFIPKPNQSIGSVLPDLEKYPQNANLPKLFQGLEIKGLKLNNRMMAAPMCQYSSDNGHATDWHLVHLGSLAARGIGGITMEATSVVPEGRISPEDAGLWQDSQIAPLKRIVDFVHAQGVPIGIQLGHAGRKASTLSPWVKDRATALYKSQGHDRIEGGDVASKEAGGWPDDVQGASSIPFSDSFPQPNAMTTEKIEAFKKAFSEAVDRCVEIGFDFIEIHGAHGYLLHNFLSPLSNDRTDSYGGSLENRLRLALEVVDIVRAKWNKALFFRVSATDWYEGTERADDANVKDNEGHGEWRFWGLDQTTILAKQIRDRGVDLIDVSSGGLYAGQKIAVRPGYQVPFAAHIKKEVPGLLVGCVGLITDSHQANEILEKDEADVIFLARELLRHADFPLKSAEELEVVVQAAPQYERAWTRMQKPIEKK